MNSFKAGSLGILVAPRRSYLVMMGVNLQTHSVCNTLSQQSVAFNATVDVCLAAT